MSEQVGVLGSQPKELLLTSAGSDFTLTRRSLVTVLVGLMVLLVVNFDGLANYVFGMDIIPGQLNPWLAPAVFGVVAVLLLKEGLLRLVSRQSVSLTKFGIMLLVCTLIVIVCSLRGDLTKGLRDLVYLWLLACAATYLQNRFRQGDLDPHLLARILGIGSVVVMPLVAWLLFPQAASQGRFAGMVLSEPLFGVSVFFAAFVVVASVQPRWVTVVTFLAALVLAVLSGTRIAFFLIGLLLATHQILVSGSPLVSRWRTAVPFLGAIAIIVGVLMFLPHYIEDPRVLSSEDVDRGSIATRLFWYAVLLQDLRSGAVIGGYGAGAAEASLGYIPHFDLLRYWYDYSLLYVVLFFGILLGLALDRQRWRQKKRARFRILAMASFVVLSFALLSLHNVMQSPGATLLLATALALTNSYFSYRQNAG